MSKIPVMVLKNKSKENRFLAASMDAGDWDDPDLDVTKENIKNAFMVWRKDLSPTTEKDLEQLKSDSAAYKKLMIKKFGDDAIISFDVEKWLEHYDPVHLEITKSDFERARNLAFM